MNWQHLRAFVWLRWRLMANGWWRGGSFNFVLTMIFAVAALVATVPLFIGSFLVGLYLFAEVAPKGILYAWDALALGFALFWCVGLLAELQRTESLSLSKFLHLPVSVQGAFLINYVSSLFGLTTIFFVPVMCGFAVGLAFSKGPGLLAALPLLAAFLLMVTAISYQFQGWLASLMSNPRRRRTVLVAVTAVFVLIAQLPNLFNFIAPWGPRKQVNDMAALAQEHDKLEHDFQAKKIDEPEYVRRQDEINQQIEERMKGLHDGMNQWQRIATLLNWVLPIGWLPLGIVSAAEGNLRIASLALIAMTLLGAGSLWRAYRTTLRIYQGGFTTGSRQATTAHTPSARAPADAAAAATVRKNSARFLEARLPRLSEPVSAIALAGLRSLIRSPEAKMMLMTPLMMSVVIGGALVRQPHDVPALVRPLSAIGAIVMVLFGMVHLMANQFGFDRDGFRVFVLCAASRRDILLGKNLAFLPLAGAMAAMLVAIVEVVAPLRLDHLLAMLPQFISMYLLFCILTNMLSIYAPMAIAAGSLKPANPKTLPILLQLMTIFLFFPVAQAPALVPLGAEALLEQLGWRRGVPIYLLLAAAECVAIAFLYGCVLNLQGRLLQGREQKILESVTKTAA